MSNRIANLLLVGCVAIGFALVTWAVIKTPTHNTLSPTKEIYHLKYCEPIPVDKVRRKERADI